MPLRPVTGGEWHVRGLCGSGELTFPYGEPAYAAQKNTRPVRALLRSIRADGGRPTFKLKSGTSDMNVVGPVWGCPIVAYGPGDSGLDHTPHERIEIGEFLRAISVLVRALAILAGEASTSSGTPLFGLPLTSQDTTSRVSKNEA